MSTMDRRHFLSLVGAGAVVGLSAARGAAADGDGDALAQPALLATLGPDVVRAIGTRYREMTVAERDPAALRAAIRSSGGARARLADLVRDDFALGRTLVVDGWVLSVTEARQCALRSLLPA